VLSLQKNPEELFEKTGLRSYHGGAQNTAHVKGCFDLNPLGPVSFQVVCLFRYGYIASF